MPLEIITTSLFRTEGWQYDKDTILNAAPQGCNALMMNYMVGTGSSKIAHWATWKKRGQHWYDLDSLLHSETGGQARLVTEADWKSFEGTIYCWVHMDAYTGHQTLVQPPDSESMLEYIQAMKETRELQWADMEQIDIQPHRVRQLCRHRDPIHSPQVVPPGPDIQTHTGDTRMFFNAIYDTLDSGTASDVELVSDNEDQHHMDHSEPGPNDKKQDPTTERPRMLPYG